MAEVRRSVPVHQGGLGARHRIHGDPCAVRPPEEAHHLRGEVGTGKGGILAHEGGDEEVAPCRHPLRLPDPEDLPGGHGVGADERPLVGEDAHPLVSPVEDHQGIPREEEETPRGAEFPRAVPRASGAPQEAAPAVIQAQLPPPGIQHRHPPVGEADYPHDPVHEVGIRARGHPDLHLRPGSGPVPGKLLLHQSEGDDLHPGRVRPEDLRARGRGWIAGACGSPRRKQQGEMKVGRWTSTDLGVWTARRDVSRPAGQRGVSRRRPVHQAPSSARGTRPQGNPRLPLYASWRFPPRLFSGGPRVTGRT
jgi:hypothetical protein